MTNVSARYGSYAMEMMINQLLKMGARRSQSGGQGVWRRQCAERICHRPMWARAMRNLCLTICITKAIAIAGQDLLDVYPRKVYFFPNSGRVLVKKLRKMHNETIIEREQAYRSRLKAADIQGDVELF